MKIRAALDADLDAVARYLAQRLQHPDGAERYRRFFTYPWMPERPNLGYLIEEGGEIRGFIGAIYARRPLGVVCNINSWAVDESHRTGSLLMAKQLLAQKDMAFTCFSPSPRVVELLEFFKLTTWPSEKLVLPLGALGSIGDELRVKVRDPRRDPSILDALHRTIFDDHQAYNLAHVAFDLGARTGYAVFGRRGRGVRTFADAMYVSDPELLMRTIGRVQLQVARMLKTPAVGIDRRWLERVPRLGLPYRKLRPLQYKGLELAQLDTLYSELVPIFG